MPGPWTDATDRKLLLTIIHLKGAAAPPNWEEVAALMGSAFTKESTRQHFQKLRKESEAEFGKPGSAPSTPPAKSTPAKPKSANGMMSSKSGGKRNDKGADHYFDDVDEVTSPAKKQRSNLKAKFDEGKEIVKVEEGEDEV